MPAGATRRRARESVKNVSDPSSGTEEGKRARRKINRGLTCANCRSRKTRCDGGQPGCKTCEVYEDDCRYDQPPPMSQILSLTQRLQDAEALIRALSGGEADRATQSADLSVDSPPSQQGFDTARPAYDATPAPAHHPVSDPDPPAITCAPGAVDLSLNPIWGQSDSLLQVQSHLPAVDLTVSSSAPPIDLSAPDRAVDDVMASQNGEHLGAGRGEGGKGISSDLSIDANGELCYYGPTSNVHETPAHSPEPVLGDHASSRTDVRSMLTSKAAESRQWEDFALGNAAYNSEIPRGTLSKLLHTHWTWIAPTFMWVYRPAFMRDMTTGGQYFSQFLLTVLCAHSARFAEDPMIGEMLISRARLMLGNEIDKPLSIPTVQALLQLSARDLAYGRISQAWLYSGMAFRMVSDLGLHHSTEKIAGLGQLNSEDLEIRRRLFWSCFFWDKAISLYLGRMPVLGDVPSNAVPELLDDSIEHESWPPAMTGAHVPSVMPHYPPQKSHAASCFVNSCRLAVIINSIMLQLYSRRGGPDLHTALPNLPNQLEEWRRKSPAHLVLDPDRLPPYSPPPNILTQNLLYFTTVILLHRPFLSSSSHRHICRQAALRTRKLLLLLESSFGFTRITYLMAYCIYTSASVLLNDVNAGDREAGEGMDTLLRALRGGIATCPVLQRSLDIITRNLRPAKSMTVLSASPAPSDQARATPAILGAHEPELSWPGEHDSSVMFGLLDSQNHSPSFDSNGTIPTSLLPAFLFSDGGSTVAADLFDSGLANDSLGTLDCFPEHRMDGLSNDWFTTGF